jgi:hypothetical protein
MEGFKHEDDWQRHPYGCGCNKCYTKFTDNFVTAFTPKNDLNEMVREEKLAKQIEMANDISEEMNAARGEED